MTQPTTTEPDLTEAMEVWRKAIDAASDSSIKFKTRADQAAARVIATALESRDAYLREQLKVDEEILADYKEREAEEALRREVRDAFFNPTLGLHRSVDILDHPNVRKAFDALRDHYQARKHVWVSCGNGGECDVCKCAHDERAPQTCPGPGTIQSGLMVPPVPSGCSLFAVNCKTGAWHYVNHADTWQGMPNPLTQARPTFEGDEAEVRENLRNVMLDAVLIPYVKDTANQALALLDAKDARIDRLIHKHGDRARERDAALARAEQAEAALAELTEQVNEANRASLSFGNQCAAAVAKARDLEAALAGERKAMSEAASYAIEDLREWLVNYPDAYDRDTTEQAITTLSRFILPAPKAAVDPLVDWLVNDEGYFPKVAERVAASLRSAFNVSVKSERAGGVKAVFGEGV